MTKKLILLQVGVVAAVTFWAFGLSEGTGFAEGVIHPFHLKVRADNFLKAGQTGRAVVLYERVLERDDQFANAYYNLATAYYLRGDIVSAAENLEAFILLRPSDAEALYNLGCLKLRLGAFEEAMKCFLRAENCPCTAFVYKKIKEALRFVKDLRNQSSENQKLLAYLASGLNPASLTA